MQDTIVKLKRFGESYKKELTLISVTLLTTAALIVGFTYLPSASSNSIEPYVPPEFSAARARAGEKAGQIAELTNLTKESLDKIKEADINGDYWAGIAIIEEERERNNTVQGIAEGLSEDLNEMAGHLGAIQPTDAIKTGINAVAAGIELVQRLIVYNNNAERLLNTLEARFQMGSTERSRAQIEELTTAMNEDAEIINRLSDGYQKLMSDFDKLTQ